MRPHRLPVVAHVLRMSFDPSEPIVLVDLHVVVVESRRESRDVLPRRDDDAAGPGVGDLRSEVRVAATQGVVLPRRVRRDESELRFRHARQRALRRGVPDARGRTRARIRAAAKADTLGREQLRDVRRPGRAVVARAQLEVRRQRPRGLHLVGRVRARAAVVGFTEADFNGEVLDHRLVLNHRNQPLDEELLHAIGPFDRQRRSARARAQGLLERVVGMNEQEFLPVLTAEGHLDGLGRHRRHDPVVLQVALEGAVEDPCPRAAVEHLVELEVGQLRPPSRRPAARCSTAGTRSPRRWCTDRPDRRPACSGCGCS